MNQLLLVFTREQVAALIAWPDTPHGYGTYYEARSKLYAAIGEETVEESQGRRVEESKSQEPVSGGGGASGG